MNDSGNSRHMLLNLLAQDSVKAGDFILASGQTSSVYIDARLTTMTATGMRLIGNIALQAIRTNEWQPDSVGGLTLGADPIAFAIAYSSYEAPKSIRAFSVRKEPKQHGTGQRIEGPFAATDRVVIVDDVITTGNSTLQAVEAVITSGAQVLGIIALVDRESGGVEAIEKHGHRVLALTRLSEILALQKS